MVDRTDSIQSQGWPHENALMRNCSPGILEVVLIKLPLCITTDADVSYAKLRPIRFFIPLQIARLPKCPQAGCYDHEKQKRADDPLRRASARTALHSAPS